MKKLLDNEINSDLYLYLISLGDVVPLDFLLDLKKLNFELGEYSDQWKLYNPRKPYNREGLSITSLDGLLSGVPDLDSLFEYNKKNNLNINEKDINVKTEVAYNITALEPLLNKFESIGRSHFIKLNQGGFFPPHRDGKILEVTCFRIIVLCQNCDTTQFKFIYDNKIISLEPGRPYFINTRKEHSVFSFVDDSVQCILNIPLTEKNYKVLISCLQAK